MSEARRPVLLLVDDAPENLEVLKGLLQADHDLKAVTSGKAALAVAKTRPDLILLDVIMPGMDGYEVCRALKDSEETRDIPIIFVTSNDAEDQISRGFETGGVDYVTKPFHPKELLARVRTHLELSFARRSMARLATDLGKYISPTLYRSIFAGEKEVAIGTSRKPLTVFFSDIVQFTPKVESMKTDEASAWLNGYLDAMAEIAIAHGGTLDKFIGDAVMVFFGDPQSEGIEKDALRCVRMARDMLAAAGRLGVNVRIGISTGECMVGNFGSKNHMAYSILGREVNVAARLESNCEPNRILMSDSTHALVKGLVPAVARGEIMVKGVDRPIQTWWVDREG